jgi:hypothetical protein
MKYLASLEELGSHYVPTVFHDQLKAINHLDQHEIFNIIGLTGTEGTVISPSPIISKRLLPVF